MPSPVTKRVALLEEEYSTPACAPAADHAVPAVACVQVASIPQRRNMRCRLKLELAGERGTRVTVRRKAADWRTAPGGMELKSKRSKPRARIPLARVPARIDETPCGLP